MHDEGNWDTQAILDGMKIVCEVPTIFIFFVMLNYFMIKVKV